MTGQRFFKNNRKTRMAGAALFVFFWLPGGSAAAQTGPEALIPWAVHAHRYQDFRRNKTACEVFGEVKNTGTKPVKSFTLHLEMLDKNGKTVANEDIELELRVIVPKNARGVLRPVRTDEFGNFMKDTVNCPENWQEGRIRYKITDIRTEQAP